MMERAAFVDMPKQDLVTIATRLYAPNGISGTKLRQAQARIYFWKGWIATRINPTNAQTNLDLALSLCDSAAYPYDHARIQLLKADILRRNGNFAEAYSLYRMKIETMKIMGDTFWQARGQVALGTIMQSLGEYPEALRYFNNAQNLFEKVGSDACFTKNKINIANLNYMLGDKQQGLAILENIEQNKYVQSDSIYLANILVSRFHISDFKDTIAARKAYEISRNIQDDNLTVISDITMSMVFFNDGNYKQSLSLLNEAYNISDRLNDFPQKKRVLENLEKCYRALGKVSNADSCKSAILELNDSIFRQEKIEDLKRIEHLSTINEYESTLRQQNEKHKMRTTLILSVSALLFIVLILLLRLLNALKKKSITDHKLQEEKNRRLELLNEQYSLDIEAKEKEIASNTVIIAQKNAKLKELADKISDMERQGEIAASGSKILSDSISNELSDNDDWQFFKLRFEKVHPLFFSSLKTEYPALSKTELRLCAYIRVGMSAKEIAQILLVKPETVNTSRYRIRKKMELKPEDTLESILERY